MEEKDNTLTLYAALIILDTGTFKKHILGHSANMEGLKLTCTIFTVPHNRAKSVSLAQHFTVRKETTAWLSRV